MIASNRESTPASFLKESMLPNLLSPSMQSRRSGEGRRVPFLPFTAAFMQGAPQPRDTGTFTDLSVPVPAMDKTCHVWRLDLIKVGFHLNRFPVKSASDRISHLC